VGPSWRQTKLVIRTINSFLRKLPKGYYHRPQRTIVRLKNGSVIEAFPNNPETIRGPTLNVVYCDEMNFIREDEDCYLPLSLITNCIDSDLEYIPFEARTKGRFYVGVDLGKKRDFSVVAVFEEAEGEYPGSFAPLQAGHSLRRGHRIYQSPQRKTNNR